MSEPESPPTKIADGDVLKKLEHIAPPANAQAVDTLALEEKGDLVQASVEALQAEIRHSNVLLWARLVMLIALFGLVVFWLLSVVGVLILQDFTPWNFAL